MLQKYLKFKIINCLLSNFWEPLSKKPMTGCLDLLKLILREVFPLVCIMRFVDFSSYSFKISATTTVMALALCTENVLAQVTSDNTTNTNVQTSDGISAITGGIQAGNNLFHSFKQFSLSTDTTANFDHAVEINNIFSRVTGGTASEINGLIQTQGNTSLFLLNPAGIIFGANAQLDIGGSFVVSTGDRLIFEDKVEFSAVDPQDKPLLTVSSPIGLQYGGNPGSIEVLPNLNRVEEDSGLSIYPSTAIALLGGDVSMTRNNLNALGGNVEIGSVKSGLIGLQADDYAWQFDYQRVSDLGTINLAEGALINVSGKTNFNAQFINVSAGSGIRDFNNFSKTKSTVHLRATESINIDGGLLLTQVGQQRATIDQAIADVGGDIIIEAPEVFLDNGSIVSAGTLSDGAGGSITINAAERVKLSTDPGKNPSIVSTSTIGLGEGGQIEINTKELTLENGSQIQALAGEGAGGTITINASETVDLSGTGILRRGDFAGNVSETELSSGLFASSGVEGLPTEEQPQGKSGNLVINTPKLSIQDRAKVSVSSYGLANAGDIKISTSDLDLNTLGEIVANTALGEGGSIAVAADGLITLDHKSSISTTAEQDSNGGNIAIAAENLVLLKSNRISADASQGNGGNITIDTTGLFVDSTSSITASSEVEQKKGTVKIFTLDLNSRLATDYVQKSSLIVANQVSRRCGSGVNLAKNQFRDVGRGGIPNNPLREALRLETVSDLGQNDYQLFGMPNSISENVRVLEQDADLTEQPLTEANQLIVNSQGVLELVSRQVTTALEPVECTVE